MDLEPLRDGHGRLIGDVRVSVTDRCNFRCQYCMPAEGLPWLERREILTFEEIARLIGLLARMGVHDVRVTGGEPLVRREFPHLASMLSGLDGVHDLALTTNGFRLERDAEALVRAGVNRFNVSVDSLQRDRFYELTRRDALPRVLAGLEALAAFPEAHPIKINAVAIRGFTEEEVLPFAKLARRTPYEVRFIEFMPLDADRAWTPAQVLTGREIRAAINAVYPLGPSAARAARHRARVPVRRRARPDRLHQPGLRAVLRRLQPDPADRRRSPAHLPVLAATRRICGCQCAPARTTQSSSRSSAKRCGARSSSTTSANRASSSRSGRCPRSAASGCPGANDRAVRG